MRRALRRLLTILTATAAAALPAQLSAKAQGSAPSAQSAAPALSGAAAGLEPFVDGSIESLMKQLNIPSGLVTIVQNGQVVLNKGYGYANLEQRTPVDPEHSLFRIGSTSKLFTWTAVMQLVEEGRIDLDADVNRYLKSVQIPAAFGAPVTMRELMTHTAGFEDGGLGYLVGNDPQRQKTIAEWVARHVPDRVRPPGVSSNYSNYGAVLAGLIVEEVSGLPFNDYMRRKLLAPLEITGTFEEPLPPKLRSAAVTGYTRSNGTYVAKPFEIVGGARPAGSASVTGSDMAHFMLMHLQGGRYANQQLLRPETVRLMHATAFQHDRRLPGIGLGIYESRLNGLQVLGHAGDTSLFHADLRLVPSKNLGVFVVFVGDGGREARDIFMRTLFDRYYPMPAQAVAPAVTTAFERQAQYAGSYQFTRRNYTGIEKLFSLLSQRSVSALPSGHLLVSGMGDEPWHLAPVGNNLFRQVDGDREVAFRIDAAGTARAMFVDSLPFMPLERTPWYERSGLWFSLLGASLLTFLGTLASHFRRRRQIRGEVCATRTAVWLSTATAGLALTLCLAVFVTVTAAGESLFAEVPNWVKLALMLPAAFIVLTALLTLAAVRLFATGGWRTAQRWLVLRTTAAAIVLSLFFWQWNVFGWEFG